MEKEKLIVPNAVMLGVVEELLNEGRSVVIMTKGSSMLPFIRGEKDSVELAAAGNLKVGDIVLARLAPGRYVLHRVSVIDGGTVTLKGDGNLVGTEMCGREGICGVVTRIITESGREIDCAESGFVRCSRIWRNLPYIVRRLFLGVYRRMI